MKVERLKLERSTQDWFWPRAIAIAMVFVWFFVLAMFVGWALRLLGLV